MHQYIDILTKTPLFGSCRRSKECSRLGEIGSRGMPLRTMPYSGPFLFLSIFLLLVCLYEVSSSFTHTAPTAVILGTVSEKENKITKSIQTGVFVTEFGSLSTLQALFNPNELPGKKYPGAELCGYILAAPLWTSHLLHQAPHPTRELQRGPEGISTLDS